MKKVFITGASGFIGANVTRSFIKKGYDVHLLLKSHKNIWRLQDILPSVTIHNGSIVNFSQLKKILEKVQPDYILHLAANGAYSTQNDLQKIIKINIEGIKNLLLATKDIQYECFINTGSSSEYGIKNSAMKETDSCEPISYYAATKLTATHLCKIFAKTYHKPIVTLRLFSVYGYYEEPTRFITTILKNLYTKQPIKLTPGNQRRDFIFIDDVIDAYHAVIRNRKKFEGEIFNIGTGEQFTNDEVVEKLFKNTKEATSIKKGSFPSRSWDTSYWVADMTKTKELLNWSPKISLDQGLLLNWKWFSKNFQYYI